MCLDKRLDVEYRKGSQQLNAIITTVSLLAVKLSPKWFASQRKARTEMIFECFTHRVLALPTISCRE